MLILQTGGDVRARVALFLATVVCSITAGGCAGSVQQADVVVYGATPAGIMAATAAAGRGHGVVLLEPSSHVGGIVSSGLSATDYWGGQYVRGPVREIFNAIASRYGHQGPAWTHEPKVAAAVFREHLARHGVRLVTEAHLEHVSVDGRRIQSVHTNRGTFSARVFVDSTYEGDLLAAAGVTFTVGREGRDRYGEPEAGIRRTSRLACPYCKHPVNPLGADGSPLPLVEPADPAPDGTADERVMNYNFRLCLTRTNANRVTIPEPERYDPERFAFFSRIAAALPHASVNESLKKGKHYDAKVEVKSAYFNMVGLPNGKFDLNSGSVFLLELPGGSHGWAQSSLAERRTIYKQHHEYTLQYFKWIRSDPAVPARIKDYIAAFGLCADEWQENEHCPPLLYVREARRMVSEHVLTGSDIVMRRQPTDSILIGFSPLDAKSTRLIVAGDTVVHDGSLYKNVPPFQLPYRVIRPRRSEVSNLLVPVAISASHVAYSAARMEPILMGLGFAAGQAAALAIEQGSSVQDVSIPTLQKRIRESGQWTQWPPARARVPNWQRSAASDGSSASHGSARDAGKSRQLHHSEWASRISTFSVGFDIFSV